VDMAILFMTMRFDVLTMAISEGALIGIVVLAAVACLGVLIACFPEGFERFRSKFPGYIEARLWYIRLSGISIAALAVIFAILIGALAK
jgi:hypothetical protein